MKAKNLPYVYLIFEHLIRYRNNYPPAPLSNTPMIYRYHFFRRNRDFFQNSNVFFTSDLHSSIAMSNKRIKWTKSAIKINYEGGPTLHLVQILLEDRDRENFSEMEIYRVLSRIYSSAPNQHKCKLINTFSIKY